MIIGRRSRLGQGLVVATAVLALTSACQLRSSSDGADPASPKAAQETAASADQKGSSGGKAVVDLGAIPDVCALLSRAEVSSLTGKRITQQDTDGQPNGSDNRYCQWQLSGGQLAVFLTVEDQAGFDIRPPGAAPVDGLGEDAFTDSGHLYTLVGGVRIDVYSRGGADDDANLATAKAVTTALLPKL